MLEHIVESYLTKRVKERGGEVRKVGWVGRRHAPDRFVMMRGRSYWVELKRPGEELRDGQAREHDRMRTLGGNRVYTLDSLDAVDAFMRVAP